MILCLTLSGCGIAVSDSAICGWSDAPSAAHAAALAELPPDVAGVPRAQATGRVLIAGLDAGCGR